MPSVWSPNSYLGFDSSSRQKAEVAFWCRIVWDYFWFGCIFKEFNNVSYTYSQGFRYYKSGGGVRAMRYLQIQFSVIPRTPLVFVGKQRGVVWGSTSLPLLPVQVVHEVPWLTLDIRPYRSILLKGPLDSIQCPHRTGVFEYLLVGQHGYVHV